MFALSSRRMFLRFALLLLPLLIIPLLLIPASAAPGDLTPAYFSAQTVIDAALAPANMFGGLQVNCPAGMVALSGGVDVNNVLNMVVTSSGPAYTNERLLFQDDGSALAPTGWQASVVNESTTARDFRVGVVCVDESAGLISEIDSSTVPAGSFSVSYADCPEGTIAVGGGVLESAQFLRGDGTLLLSDFHAAFFVVGAICAISTVMFMRLPANAGHELTREPHAY